MTTGLLRAGTTSGKEKACACTGAWCMHVFGLAVIVYMRVRGGGGGGRPSIMVCPLRGNYAESRVSVGGGIIMGCLPPLCVCEDVS